MALFNSSRHCGTHFQGTVSLNEIVISEIQRDRSFKIFNLFAESVRKAGKAAAMYPQCVILLFNVARGNPVNVRRTAHNRLFHGNNFGGAVPNGGGFAERGNGVGFYNLPVILPFAI